MTQVKGLQEKCIICNKATSDRARLERIDRDGSVKKVAYPCCKGHIVKYKEAK